MHKYFLSLSNSASICSKHNLIIYRHIVHFKCRPTDGSKIFSSDKLYPKVQVKGRCKGLPRPTRSPLFTYPGLPTLPPPFLQLNEPTHELGRRGGGGDFMNQEPKSGWLVCWTAISLHVASGGLQIFKHCHFFDRELMATVPQLWRFKWFPRLCFHDLKFSWH